MLPLRLDYELTGCQKSLDSVITAAYHLGSRFSERTGAIRSWNVAESKVYNISNTEQDFLVIIDSMANIDLLFYVSNYTGDRALVDKATKHARTVAYRLVRPDFSTFHVANLDPANGELKYHFTHQGYSDTSCWSRYVWRNLLRHASLTLYPNSGQAWAILGFTQTYIWTTDPTFLVIAMSLANYFTQRLSRIRLPHSYVPPWDFDAPLQSDGDTLRDTSAGMIAVSIAVCFIEVRLQASILKRFFTRHD